MKNKVQLEVELQDSMGGDRSIASAAWTSSTKYKGKKLKTDEQVTELVTRLANDGHSTPFESVIFRFWIKMPISTDRQFMTHRIQSSSGMSGRYRTMPNEYLYISEDVVNISNKFIKNSGNIPTNDFVRKYNEICNEANSFYNSFMEDAKLAKGDLIITNDEYKRFREFSRGMLPQHNMTERVSIMNLRSFANFQKLRNSSHAQPEIKQIAQLMLDEVKEKTKCPVALEVLEKKGWIL